MIVPLTQNKHAIIDDGDYGLISKHKWHCMKCSSGHLYAVTNIYKEGKQTKIRMHNLILGICGVDHKDGDGLNNRRSNLRPANQAQNSANRRVSSNNKSGFKGVSWHRKSRKWRAIIYSSGKQIHLGFFKSSREAADAYDEAARIHFGQFAKLNRVEGGTIK
jgi:hypothetical protein